jgi:hypothetical protein
MPCRRPRHRNQLPRFAVAADLVFEPARQSDRPFRHRLIDERRHFLDLVVSRRSFVVVPHHAPSDGGVARHDEDVQRRGMRAAFGEVGGDRPRRRPVGADDDGGDPLRDLRRRARFVGQRAGRMIVQVDEPGGEHQSRAVDDAVSRAWFDIADRDDPILLEPHVAAASATAAAVDDPRAGDGGGRWCGVLPGGAGEEEAKNSPGKRYPRKRRHASSLADPGALTGRREGTDNLPYEFARRVPL